MEDLNNGKVFIVKTTPESVLQDYAWILREAKIDKVFDRASKTFLKVNISWDRYYPGCSTAPWQLEGVIKELKRCGINKLIAAHNGTVVVNPERGRIENKHKNVEDKYGIEYVVLDAPESEWVHYKPKRKLLILDKIFPDGIKIPSTFYDSNIIHLPTMKTHVFTTMTGAMKNAFGGLLNYNRHWTHADIHKTLVDLLVIQQDIHKKIFAVSDGAFSGDGPGPRAMRIKEKNIIVGGYDQVAVDAVVAKMMGFDPMKIEKLRIAHELKLGVAKPEEIRIIGEDVSSVNWHYSANENTFASKGQKLIYWGPLKPLEKFLLRSKIAPWAFFASDIYHNKYWLRFIGKSRIRKAMKSKWGKLFQRY